MYTSHLLAVSVT